MSRRRVDAGNGSDGAGTGAMGSASRLDVVLQAGLDRLSNLSLCETDGEATKRNQDDLKAAMKAKTKGDLEKQSEAPEEPPFKMERSNGYFELTFFQGANPLVVETVFGLQVLSALGQVDVKLANSVATMLLEINENETDEGPAQPLEPASTSAPPVLDPSLEPADVLNRALKNAWRRWGSQGSLIGRTYAAGTALTIAWGIQPIIYANFTPIPAQSGALATLFTPPTASLILSLTAALAGGAFISYIGDVVAVGLDRLIKTTFEWNFTQAKQLVKLVNQQRPGHRIGGPHLVPIRNHYLCELKARAENSDDLKYKYNKLEHVVLGEHLRLGGDWHKNWEELKAITTNRIVKDKWINPSFVQSFLQRVTGPRARSVPLQEMKDNQEEFDKAVQNAQSLVNSCTDFHTVIMWLYVLVTDPDGLANLNVNSDKIVYTPADPPNPIDLYTNESGAFTTVPPPVALTKAVQRASAEAYIEDNPTQVMIDARVNRQEAENALKTAEPMLTAAEPVLAAAELALAAAEEASDQATADWAEASAEQDAADELDEEAAGAVREAAQSASDAYERTETAKRAVDEAKTAMDEAKAAVDEAKQAVDEARQKVKEAKEAAIKAKIDTFGVYDNPGGPRCPVPNPNATRNASPTFTKTLERNHLWWTDETS